MAKFGHLGTKALKLPKKFDIELRLTLANNTERLYKIQGIFVKESLFRDSGQIE